jgi:chromosome segregation ATPase
MFDEICDGCGWIAEECQCEVGLDQTAEIDHLNAELAEWRKRAMGHIDELDEKDKRIASLEAELAKAREERDAAYEALAVLKDPRRWPVNLEDITAEVLDDLDAMTSRYSRAAADIASLEAELAEAKVLLRGIDYTLDTCADRVDDPDVSRVLRDQRNEIRAAIDEARGE